MPSLATLLLWGPLALGAASIPIVLHFFYRSRYRVVPWAAMEFLLTSIQQTSRRLRFQEILLLAARVALMLFLALAMMRPSCTSLSSSGRGEAVDAVGVGQVEDVAAEVVDRVGAGRGRRLGAGGAVAAGFVAQDAEVAAEDRKLVGPDVAVGADGVAEDEDRRVLGAVG